MLPGHSAILSGKRKAPTRRTHKARDGVVGGAAEHERLGAPGLHRPARGSGAPHRTRILLNGHPPLDPASRLSPLQPAAGESLSRHPSGPGDGERAGPLSRRQPVGDPGGRRTSDQSLGGLSRGNAHTDFFIFGVWSAAAGLRRVPVSPLFDIGTMLEESGRVLDLLKREAANLPFAPLPMWELWLLDQAEGRPLALLGGRARRGGPGAPAARLRLRRGLDRPRGASSSRPAAAPIPTGRDPSPLGRDSAAYRAVRRHPSGAGLRSGDKTPGRGMRVRPAPTPPAAAFTPGLFSL